MELLTRLICETNLSSPSKFVQRSWEPSGSGGPPGANPQSSALQSHQSCSPAWPLHTSLSPEPQFLPNEKEKKTTMLSKCIRWHWLISRTGLLFPYWWEWVRREIRIFLELLNRVENFTFHYSYQIKTLAIKLWLGSFPWRCCLLSDYLQNGDCSQMAKKED